jgi:hypothetical protein
MDPRKPHQEHKWDIKLALPQQHNHRYMTAVPQDTHSRAMPSRLHNMPSRPQDMRDRKVITTLPERTWPLIKEARQPGYPFPRPNPGMPSTQLQATLQHNKTAGLCITHNNHPRVWQLHQLNIPHNNQQILIMVVVRTITSHLHDLCLAHEKFLTF